MTPGQSFETHLGSDLQYLAHYISDITTDGQHRILFIPSEVIYAVSYSSSSSSSSSRILSELLYTYNTSGRFTVPEITMYHTSGPYANVNSGQMHYFLYFVDGASGTPEDLLLRQARNFDLNNFDWQQASEKFQAWETT